MRNHISPFKLVGLNGSHVGTPSIVIDRGEIHQAFDTAPCLAQSGPSNDQLNDDRDVEQPIWNDLPAL